MNEVLNYSWREKRGLEIVTVALNSATLSKEDEDAIKDLQKKAAYANSKLGAGAYTEAATQAMKDAANNAGGSMLGFMGMNMAQGFAANNAANIMSANQQYNQAQQAAADTAAAAAGWKCACGAMATGKFCTECGAKKPEENGWTCSCGAVNKGKFCSECGAKKPEGAPLYRCDKCGWEPDDPKNPPKFCPECGDPFDEKDVK